MQIKVGHESTAEKPGVRNGKVVIARPMGMEMLEVL